MPATPMASPFFMAIWVMNHCSAYPFTCTRVLVIVKKSFIQACGPLAMAMRASCISFQMPSATC